MRKSIGENYIYNLMYQLMAILIPLVTTPYISQILGATAIGDYSYTSGIVSYFGLVATTGTVNFAQKKIAVYENDIKKRSILFWEILLFRLICSIFVLIGYSIFIFNYMSQYRTLYIIQYFTVFSWLADISWHFQGTENFKITSARNTIVKLGGTILIFLFVKEKSDLWLYTLIMSAMMLCGNLTMWHYVQKEIIWPGISQIHILKNTGMIIELFIPVISIQLYTVLDKTMLGTLCNTTEVGYYAQAEKIVKLALTVLNALSAVLLPRIAILYANKDIKKIREYYKKTLNFIFMLALPMLVGCILLADAFVPVFFGKGYDDVINLLKLESSLFIILSLGQVFGNFLIPMNKQRDFTIAVTVAALVNISFNYIFIKTMGMGAVGAVMASVLAECVSSGIQFCAIREILKRKYILQILGKYLFPAAIMGIFIYSIGLMIGGIRFLIVGMLGGEFVYIGILIIMKNDVIFECLEKALMKIKK